MINPQSFSKSSVGKYGKGSECPWKPFLVEPEVMAIYWYGAGFKDKGLKAMRFTVMQTVRFTIHTDSSCRFQCQPVRASKTNQST